jgi:hypothetical protein
MAENQQPGSEKREDMEEKQPKKSGDQGGFRKNIPEQKEEEVERRGTDDSPESERRGGMQSPSKSDDSSVRQ